jgi:hypothetical protein
MQCHPPFLYYNAVSTTVPLPVLILVTYGIQLWGCTKPSNTKIIKRFQSKVLHLITNAPWYVSNLSLHNDLQIPFVIEEIHRLSTLYRQSVLRHNNRLVAENSDPPNAGRLRRQWPSDLPQPADEKSWSHHSPPQGLQEYHQWMISLLKTPTYRKFTHK